MLDRENSNHPFDRKLSDHCRRYQTTSRERRNGRKKMDGGKTVDFGELASGRIHAADAPGTPLTTVLGLLLVNEGQT